MTQTIKTDAIKKTFEKMTGVPDAWNNPALMQSRNGFIAGFDAGIMWLAEQHKAECGEERPIQNWIQTWGKI
jgi:hypothetical protein